MLIEEVAAMLHGKREFVCVDLETTGVSTRSRVIEIGAVLRQLIDFVGDRVVVAHNLPFENRFLGSELERALMEPGDNVGFCTYSAARRFVSTGTNHKLATLAEHFGIREGSSHRALPDARVGAHLAFKLLQLVASGALMLRPPSSKKITPASGSMPTRLAAVRQGYRPQWKPSDEQDAILEAFFGQGDIKILAGAGTGKTTTLQLLANSTKSTITYLAFNKATAVEAQEKFATNVSATTIHAFAYADLIGQGKAGWLGRLDLGIEPFRVTADRLGATEPGFIEAFGRSEVARVLKPYDLTKMAVETVIKFCHSPNRKLLPRHVRTGRAAASLRPALVPLVLLMAEEHWANILDEGVSDMPILHDHYLKRWLLSDPVLGAKGEILFVDEAQDLSPAVAAIIQAQRHLKKVFVGDPNQSIYGFAGGKDALATILTAHTLPLTTSWRFGEGAAVLANGWLRTLNARHLLRPNPLQITTVGHCEHPDAVLTRTNAVAVDQLMSLQRLGRRVTLRADHQGIQALLRAAGDLKEGRRASHSMLRSFSSWDEVKEHVRHDSSAHELVTWTRLIGEYGIPELDNAITVASLWSKEGAVVSTAHKAKGLEWDTVRIADDFAVLLERAALSGNKEHLAEEKRLAYVAVTRARRCIDPGPLAHFADFMNR
jgi:hypothetical protein